MRMVRRQTEVFCSIPGKGKSTGTSLDFVSMCSDENLGTLERFSYQSQSGQDRQKKKKEKNKMPQETTRYFVIT